MKWFQTIKNIYEEYILNERSKGALHPQIEQIAKEHIKRAKLAGLNVAIFNGFRSFDEQNKLYAKGRTESGSVVTNARGGHSWHNYGLAYDLVFRVGNKWSWDTKHDWKKLGKIGEQLGLSWGGGWTKFKDYPHFEYTGQWRRPREALELYLKGGLKSVWSKLGEIKWNKT